MRTENSSNKFSRMRKAKRKRMRKRQTIFAFGLAFMIVLITAGIFGFIRFVHPFLFTPKEITVEAGSAVDKRDVIPFIPFANMDEVEVIKEPSTSKVGHSIMNLKLDEKTLSILVNIEDSTPPEVDVHDYQTDLLTDVNVNQFIQSAKDRSGVSLKLDMTKDKKEPGTYEMEVIASDPYKNTTIKKVKLTRSEDKKSPKIEVSKTPIEIKQGHPYETDKVKVSDNYDPNPVVEINTDGLDISTPGTYDVIYTATDRSGNIATEIQKVTVLEDPDYQKKIVYLTFDDGPSENTAHVLDVLKKYGAKATFFVTGNYPEYYDMMKRAYDEGHAVGLHTFTHDYASIYQSDEAYFEDLQKISDIVESVTGNKSNLIRFPGGSSNTVSANYNKGIMSRLVNEVQEKGYQYFDWNVSSSDASGNNVPVEKLISSSTGYTEDRLVILFHDGPAKQTSWEALPEIIEYYKDRGYEFRALDSQAYPAHHGVSN